MEKHFKFRGEECITVSKGDNRVHIHLFASSHNVSGEQKAELEGMFDALCSTVNTFIDENNENFEKIFPETEED